MAVPVSQMYTVAHYALSQHLRGVNRYPLVLMLEPLFRCNLECAGCGKIQYPDHILNPRLTRAFPHPKLQAVSTSPQGGGWMVKS